MAEEGAQTLDRARRPPFAVALPSAAFPIAAFAEAWEYEDDEDMFGVDDDDDDEDNYDVRGGGAGRDQGRGKSKTIGVLERRANVTVVGGEVVISKEARGDVKVRTVYSCTSFSETNGCAEFCFCFCDVPHSFLFPPVQPPGKLHVPVGRGGAERGARDALSRAQAEQGARVEDVFVLHCR